MKIAVFHHGVLTAPGLALGQNALNVLLEQIYALQASGLAEAATELHFGMDNADLLLLASLVPKDCILHPTGDGSQGEKPTMMALQAWVPGHEDWFVLYHHMKGCTNGKHVARHCMEQACVWNWEQCLADLKTGKDAVGCHWLDWRRHAIPHGHRIFGGNFWWTTGAYLAKLPPLGEEVNNGKFFEGEIWIGRCAGEPKIKDYHPRGRGCAL